MPTTPTTAEPLERVSSNDQFGWRKMQQKGLAMNQQALAQLIREWYYVHHDNDTETTIDGIFSLFELASYLEQRIKAPAEGQKFDKFMSELARLCVAHGVKISPSGYDGLQVWDATDGDEPVHFNGIEDCTKPNVELGR